MEDPKRTVKLDEDALRELDRGISSGESEELVELDDALLQVREARANWQTKADEREAG